MPSRFLKRSDLFGTVPGRRCSVLLAAFVALLAVSACNNNDSNTQSNQPNPVGQSSVTRSVELSAEQMIFVTADQLSAQSRIGQLSYSATGLDTENALSFALTGAQAGSFEITSRGVITVASAINPSDLPLSLMAAASIGTNVLASVNLTIAAPPGQTLDPGRSSSIDIPAGQRFAVSDNQAGALVGRLNFTAMPADLRPAFSFFGTGAENFGIDSQGQIRLARAIAAEQFAFELAVSAVLPFIENPKRTTLSIVSAEAVTEPSLPPRPSSMPLSAEALVFDLAAPVTIDSSSSNFSEASAPGACVARFSRTSPVGDRCWAFIQTPATASASEHPIVFDLDDDSRSDFIFADNLLLLKNPPRIADTDDPEASVSLERKVRVSGRFAAHEQASEVEIVLPLVAAPSIDYQMATLENIPTSSTGGVIEIGHIGFSIANGALDRRLEFDVSRIPPGLGLRVDGDGVMRFDTSTGTLTANRRYQVTVTARIPGYAPAGEVPREIVFTTAPPQLSFGLNQYSVAVNPANNVANAKVATIAVRAFPRQSLVSYEIINDSGDNFYAGDGGQIFLRQQLTAPASATLRAVAGAASASASFTISPAQSGLDFTAVPVDDDVSRRNISFSAMLPPGTNVTSYDWDFGDGSTSTETNPTKLYSTTGSFVVSLEIMTDGGQSYDVSHRVYPHLADDPYKRMQWHLRQPVLSPFLGVFPDEGGLFSDTGNDVNDLVYTTAFHTPRDPNTGMFAGQHTTAVANEDIRAVDHLDTCGVLDTCRGEGVVVLVADRGVEISHPDLIDNTSRRLSRNLIFGAQNLFNPHTSPPASPIVALPGSNLLTFLRDRNMLQTHGTSVAGIILARDANDIGVVGVAPRAELASYNLLDAGLSNLSQTAVFSADHDVGNHSWSTTRVNSEFQPVDAASREAIEQAASDGRDGRGVAMFKSAGNDGAGPPDPTGVLDYPNDFGNYHNSGLDGHNALPEMMVIGGVRASGEENVQSEAGANILLSAYWNLPCRYSATADVTNPVNNPVGIVTTDLTGNFGSSWGASPVFASSIATEDDTFLGAINPVLEEAFEPFEVVGLSLAVEPLSDMSNYNYCFNGTSGAAPQVSGAAALMLQARPELTWRDVRSILVNTARQNDADNLDSDWAPNGAGLEYHHSFGFGVVDTTAAVDMAKGWTLIGDEFDHQAPQTAGSFVVADCSGDCGTTAAVEGTPSSGSASVVGQMDFVETVEAAVAISFRAAPGVNPASLLGGVEIVLEHRDASGDPISRSLLQKRHPYYEAGGIGGGGINPQNNAFEFEWTYLSMQHYGEDSEGTWNLVVTDFFDDNSQIEVTGWQLNFRGYNK